MFSRFRRAHRVARRTLNILEQAAAVEICTGLLSSVLLFPPAFLFTGEGEQRVRSGESKTALSRAKSACFLGIRKHRGHGVSTMMNVRQNGKNPFSSTFDENFVAFSFLPCCAKRVHVAHEFTHAVNNTDTR